MRFYEIQSNMYCYAATVRAKQGKSSTIAKTVLFADGFAQAKALLQAMYGENSIVSLNRISDEHLSEDDEKKRIVPRIVPSIYKHDLLRKKLLQQVKLDAMRVMPTTADISAAKNEFETQQKRMDLEYAKAVKEKQKWADVRKRRLRDSR